MGSIKSGECKSLIWSSVGCACFLMFIPSKAASTLQSVAVGRQFLLCYGNRLLRLPNVSFHCSLSLEGAHGISPVDRKPGKLWDVVFARD